MRLPERLRRPRLLLLLPAAVVPLLVGARIVRSLDAVPTATVTLRPGRFVREVEARGLLKAVKVTPIMVPQQMRRSQRIAALASDGAALKAGDLVVAFDPYEAQREQADGLNDLDAARARIDKAGAEGRKTRRSIEIDRGLAREELTRAESFRLDDERLYSRHEIVESRLSRDLAATKLELSGSRLATSGKLSAAERALGAIEAGKANLKLELARKSLSALRLAAPHDGLFVLERNWRGEIPSVGDTLWPGQKIGELPDLSQLEAKVFVLEADGAGLRGGLKARLSIEGRPGEEHEATVKRVDPLAKASGWQSPVKYFEAVLSLARTDPTFMKPGQRVRAIVRLDEAENVLVLPRAAVFDKDGKRVVYRRQAGSFVPVEVTIGRQSISSVVVDQGLSAGAVVALRDPSARRPAAAPARGDTEPGR
jgi:multidrug resistance efflux pump